MNGYKLLMKGEKYSNPYIKGIASYVGYHFRIHYADKTKDVTIGVCLPGIPKEDKVRWMTLNGGCNEAQD